LAQFTLKGGGDKAHRRKERKTKKSTIKFIINDLENKLHFIEESHQYKDYKPFFTDMWDAIILTGRHSLLSFEIFEDLQHTYSWMKYYNTELDVNIIIHNFQASVTKLHSS